MAKATIAKTKTAATKGRMKPGPKAKKKTK